MKKSQKIWVVIAIILLVLGMLIFVSGLAAMRFDFKKMNTQKYVTNTHKVEEDFDKIDIDTNMADVAFVVADDGECKVVCHEEEKAKHAVMVQNSTLFVECKNTKKWYDHIGVSFEKTAVTIYLSQNTYEKLAVNTDTGNVEMPKDFSFENAVIETDTGHVDWCAPVTDVVKVATDTGRVQMSDVICGNVVAETDTGDIVLKNVVASQNFSIESDTGDVEFESSDAKEIYVKTDTGDVVGTLLSEKIFNTETATGSIDVPRSKNGGTCEITTATGDIKIVIE